MVGAYYFFLEYILSFIRRPLYYLYVTTIFFKRIVIFLKWNAVIIVITVIVEKSAVSLVLLVIFENFTVLGKALG